MLHLPLKEIPKVAPDGVREWECLFANPYRESYSEITSSESAHLQRKRLVAALCLQEMCTTVGGAQLSTNCATDTASLIQGILRLAAQCQDERRENMLRKLAPLTLEQAMGRFGSLDGALEGLSEKECTTMVFDFLTKSPWIKRLGISTAPSVGSSFPVEPTQEEDVIVDLAGLDAYLRGA